MVEVKDVYAIPLDISGVSDLISFSRKKPQDISSRYTFCAVISVDDSVGIKIVISKEVFNWIDSVESNVFDELLMEPLVVSGVSILKNRWRKVICKGELNFDKYDKYITVPVTVWRGSQVEKEIVAKLGVDL